MKIVSQITAATADFVVQSEIKELVFKIAFVTASLPASIAAAVTALASAKLTVSFVSDGSPVRLCSNLPLDVLFEYTGADEGVNYAVTSSGSVESVWVSLPIAAAGSISLRDDDQIQVSVTGLPTGTGASTDVYGLQVQTRDVQVMQFHRLTVPADVLEKEFRIDDQAEFILPSSGFDSVQIEYVNGISCSHTLEELKYLATRTNEIVALSSEGDAFVGGFGSYLVLGIDDATKLSVYRSSGSAVSIWAVGSRVVRHPSAIKAVNDGLYSTTERKALSEAAIARS